ncbi:Flagellar protein FliS [compost metagenome]
MRQGGEIAKNLRSLYMYMVNRLIEGNIRKSEEAVTEVIQMLEELKTAWEEIGKGGTLE